MILCVSAIRKKISSQKEKTFLLGVFLPIAGEKRGRRGREIKRGKTKRRAIHPPVNSNLPVEALLERKSIAFYKQGKNAPLL